MIAQLPLNKAFCIAQLVQLVQVITTQLSVWLSTWVASSRGGGGGVNVVMFAKLRSTLLRCSWTEGTGKEGGGGVNAVSGGNCGPHGNVSFQ